MERPEGEGRLPEEVRPPTGAAEDLGRVYGPGQVLQPAAPSLRHGLLRPARLQLRLLGQYLGRSGRTLVRSKDHEGPDQHACRPQSSELLAGDETVLAAG